MTYTIKTEGWTAHIAGLTTESGRPIHQIPAGAETGRTFGALKDAVADVDASRVPMCRTCRVAAEMVLNRQEGVRRG